MSKGRRLTIPVLMGQGVTDTLFPLREALENWHRALTPKARRHSILIGYDGGHTIGAVTGLTLPVASDPCSAALAGSDFLALTVRFLREQLKGQSTGLTGYGEIHMTTPDEACVSMRDDAPTRTYAADDLTLTTGAGATSSVKLADGPLRIAGSSELTAAISSIGLDDRAFLALAVGASPATATIIQDNVVPLRLREQTDGTTMRIQLPAVAVEVPEGQALYLVAAPTNSVFAVMGSRTPGLITMSKVQVSLPVR